MLQKDNIVQFIFYARFATFVLYLQLNSVMLAASSEFLPLPPHSPSA